MASRIERLVKAIGEENLPPKLPQPDTEELDPTAEDAFRNLQSVDDSLQQNDDSENWWDATPQIPQQPQQSTGQSQTKPIATPFFSQGEAHFEFDPRKGEVAPLGISFSPFGGVTKFCYKFVKKELVQPIATAFFDNSKIQNREWDL